MENAWLATFHVMTLKQRQVTRVGHLWPTLWKHEVLEKAKGTKMDKERVPRRLRARTRTRKMDMDRVSVSRLRPFCTIYMLLSINMFSPSHTIICKHNCLFPTTMLYAAQHVPGLVMVIHTTVLVVLCTGKWASVWKAFFLTLPFSTVTYVGHDWMHLRYGWSCCDN